jgi:hypothetical protein
MLSQLHAELAGKLLENRSASVKTRIAMMQVEAVLPMLQLGFSVAAIAAAPQQEQPLVQARKPVSRGGCVLRRAGSRDDGAGDRASG